MDLARLDSGDAVVRQHVSKVDELVSQYGTLLSRMESKKLRLSKLREKTPRSINFEPQLISSKESELLFAERIAALRAQFNAANGTNIDEMKRTIVAMTELEIETLDTRIKASVEEAKAMFTETYYLTHKDLVNAGAFTITPTGQLRNALARAGTADAAEMDYRDEPYPFDTRDSFLEHVQRINNYMESTAITHYRTLISYIETKFVEAFFLHRLKANAAAIERRARATLENAAETAELTADRPEMIQDTIERLVNKRLETANKRIAELEKSTRRPVSQSPNVRQTFSNSSTPKNVQSGDFRAQSPARNRRSPNRKGKKTYQDQTPNAAASKNQGRSRHRRNPVNFQRQSGQRSNQSMPYVQNQAAPIPYFPVQPPAYPPLNYFNGPPPQYNQGTGPRVRFEDEYRPGGPPPTRLGSYLDAALTGTYEGEPRQPKNAGRRPYEQPRGRARSRTRSPG